MVSAQSIAGPTQPQLLQPLPPNAALAAQPTQPNAITANGSLHPLTPSMPSAIGSLTATSGTSTGSGNTSNTGGSSASTRNGSSSRGSSSKRQSSAHSINSVLSSAGVVKHIVGRYNRRNNPELEKRRIHHCDFIGKYNHTVPCLGFRFLFHACCTNSHEIGTVSLCVVHFH